MSQDIVSSFDRRNTLGLDAGLSELPALASASFAVASLALLGACGSPPSAPEIMLPEGLNDTPVAATPLEDAGGPVPSPGDDANAPATGSTLPSGSDSSGPGGATDNSSLSELPVGPSAVPLHEPSTYDFGAEIRLTPTEVTRDRLMAGGDLVLPPGVFEIDGQITITRPTRLVGSGRAADDGTNTSDTTELRVRLGSRVINVDLARLDADLNEIEQFVDDPNDPNDDDDAPIGRITESAIRIESSHVEISNLKVTVELAESLDSRLEGKGDTGTAITVGRFFARHQPRVSDVDLHRLTLNRDGRNAAAMALVGNVDDIDIVDVDLRGWSSTALIMHWGAENGGAENPTYTEASEAFLYDDYCITESFHPHNIYVDDLDVDRTRGLFILSSSYDISIQNVHAAVASEVLLALPGDETNHYAGATSHDRIMSNIHFNNVVVDELRFFTSTRPYLVRTTSVGTSRTHRVGENRSMCPESPRSPSPQPRLKHSVDYVDFVMESLTIGSVRGESDQPGRRFRYGLNLQDMRGTDVRFSNIDLSTIGQEVYISPEGRQLASFGAYLRNSTGIQVDGLTSRARYGVGIYNSERVGVAGGHFVAPSGGPLSYGAFLTGFEAARTEDILLRNNRWEGFDIGVTYRGEGAPCRRLHASGLAFVDVGAVEQNHACLVEYDNRWQTRPTATISSVSHAPEFANPARGGLFEISLSEPQDRTTLVAFQMGGSAALNRDYTIAVPDGIQMRGTAPIYRVYVPPGETRVPLLIEATSNVAFLGDNDLVEFSLVEWPTRPYRLFEENVQASLSLLAEDELPAVSIGALTPSVPEGGTAQFRVSLDRPASQSLAVWFRLTGGAYFNRDYRIESASMLAGRYPDYRVVIPAGETAAVLDIVTLADTSGEPTETVVLSLTNQGSGLYNVANRSAELSISDAGGFEGFDIVVIAGQSNAAGAGLDPHFQDTWGGGHVDMRIKQIGRLPGNDVAMPMRGIGHYSEPGTPRALWDGLEHHNRIEQPRMGFGLTFARGYVRTELRSNRELLLVPAAFGATSIEMWRELPGQLLMWPPGETAEPVYLRSDMLQRVQHAMSASPGQHRVVAMLWHQGEADVRQIAGALSRNPSTDVEHHLDNYTQMLEAFLVNEVRPQLGPNVPIVVGELSHAWTTVDFGSASAPNLVSVADIVRGFHQRLHALATRTPAMAVAPARDLSPRMLVSGEVDPVHFSSSSLITMGRRYHSALARASSE